MQSRSLSFLSITLLLVTPFLLTSVEGQFGIPKVPASLAEQNGEDMGEEVSQGGGGAAKNSLKHNAGGEHSTGEQEGFISDKDAADMEAILIEAQKDVETMAMITKMKTENPQHIAELMKMPQNEILGGMKETLDNLRLIEYLFKDKEKAVREMEKEGMIDKAHIKKYRKNPELLEQDTRRGLYFQFITLATVGGFFE